MQFQKWEAVGNDFVLVVDSAARAAWGEGWLVPERVRDWCDRRRGVGADGILIVHRLDAHGASMIIMNADGSRAEMCGNGVRCVAGFVAEHGSLERGTFAIVSDVGERPCELTRVAPGSYDVSVRMGSARVGGRVVYAHAERSIELVEVDVGNPHVVTFDAEAGRQAAELGPKICHAIEGGSNVEFCHTGDEGRRIDVTVFERGVGPTLACGTGACAAATAAVAGGRSPASQPLSVELPGGTLTVTVDPTADADRYDVALRGSARRVFVGEL